MLLVTKPLKHLPEKRVLLLTNDRPSTRSSRIIRHESMPLVTKLLKHLFEKQVLLLTNDRWSAKPSRIICHDSMLLVTKLMKHLFEKRLLLLTNHWSSAKPSRIIRHESMLRSYQTTESFVWEAGSHTPTYQWSDWLGGGSILMFLVRSNGWEQ